MMGKGVSYKFHKIHGLYSVDLNTLDDVMLLVKRLLNDDKLIVGELSSSNTDDFELIEDVLHLIDIARDERDKENSKKYKDLIYLVVSTCLSNNVETLSSILVHRLYKRGFSSNLIDTFVQYYSKTLKYDSTEEHSNMCILSKNDSTLSICCKILKYLSKFIYVEKNEQDYILCIDTQTNYIMIKKIISIMFGSYLNRNNSWNYSALSKLFHPFSTSYLPCLILYIIIDSIDQEVKIKLLEQLAYFYSDSELIRNIHVTKVAYLSGCISRLLYYTVCSYHSSLGNLSKVLTKAITSGLETLDPIIRMSAMTIAESYSVFMYNNSKSKDESMLLKFGSENMAEAQNLINLLAFKSKVIINPNFSNMKRKSSEMTQQKEINKPEEKCVQDEAVNQNEEFLDFIFSSVPSINMKTVDGYVNETWLKPPQHIIQCYERLLSKPARGDVDYECINTHPLDRLDGESVENKILRISQTLLHLPHVINKNESILGKYAVPISTVLLKLDDLDLYREKMKEMANENLNKITDSGSNSGASQIISNEPEKLILVSLTLISYYCPQEIVNYYSSHLFDTDFTLSARITMILCIQYTSIAINGSLDGDALVKKVLCDSLTVNGDEKKANGVKPLEINRDVNTRSDLNIKLFNDVNKIQKNQNGSLHLSYTDVKNYNNKTIDCLLNSLRVYYKKNILDRAPMDEDISTAIFETILIIISSCVIEEGITTDLKEMVKCFGTVTGSQKFKTTLKMIEIVLSTHQIPHISTY